MRWVRQWHSTGCGIAVLAMLTGEDYGAVRSEIDGQDGHGHDGDWNAHGVSYLTLERFLISRGFYAQRLYLAWYCRRVDERENPADPVRFEPLPAAVWPPEPWAALHYASVRQPSGNSHFVAMDADGRVLDPLREGHYSLSDWPQVENVTGLCRPG